MQRPKKEQPQGQKGGMYRRILEDYPVILIYCEISLKKIIVLVNRQEKFTFSQNFCLENINAFIVVVGVERKEQVGGDNSPGKGNEGQQERRVILWQS